jgi:uncharacterized membrane protein
MLGRAFDMSDATPVPPRRPNILLIVSLCLNIVLVPVIAAVVIRAVHRDSVVGAGGVLAPRSVMSAVPGERVRIQAIIDGHAPKVLALRAAAAQARRHAFVTLAAPDFTQESFSRSLADVANADSALERENIAMMAQSLAVLTPQERQAMVTRTKARNHSWFWRMFRPRPARF